jgi:NAD(P)-dependent dehydrogenase (short-subunit alcohol dehydrogenase family)
MPWSAAQLPSLAGRTALVTGGSSGIGWHASLELARHGARVRLTSRDPGRGRDAVRRIRELVPAADVEPVRLDLASLASVEAVAGQWDGPLHLLVNNAGVMAPPRLRRTSDGFELQFGTNHLGHFALTGRLLPALLAAQSGARVVTVSSLLHWTALSVPAPVPPAGYHPQRAYASSKLANLLFAFELQRRAEAQAAPLTSTAAHPGVSRTNLMLTPEGMGARAGARWMRNTVGQLAFQSAAAGAESVLYAAAVAAPGSYSGPQWPGGMRGPAGPARASWAARDVALAASLWNASEELTGVRYDWPAHSLR